MSCFRCHIAQHASSGTSTRTLALPRELWKESGTLAHTAQREGLLFRGAAADGGDGSGCAAARLFSTHEHRQRQPLEGKGGRPLADQVEREQDQEEDGGLPGPRAAGRAGAAATACAISRMR